MEKEKLVDELKDYRDMLAANEKIISIVSNMDHGTAIQTLAAAINTCLLHRGYTAHVIIKPLIFRASLE